MKNKIKNIFKKENDPLSPEDKLKLIESSSKLVGPGVFYSTIIVITSFLPVFLLTGMEGKLFGPLAWTKSFILIVDAFLAITLTPVLISFLLKGKLRPEDKNPINKKLESIYTPILIFCLKWRKTVLGINIIALLIGVLMFTRLGSEFMPPLDEGSVLFMPVTLPDVSNSEVKRILQVQDKLIKSIPEVAHVLGKAGRANTATDNSPISMVETIILLITAESYNNFQILPILGFSTGFVLWKKLDINFNLQGAIGFKAFQKMFFKYTYRGTLQETAVFEGRGTGIYTSFGVGYRFFKEN